MNASLEASWNFSDKFDYLINLTIIIPDFRPNIQFQQHRSIVLASTIILVL